MPRLCPIPSGHTFDCVLACTLGPDDTGALALRTTRGMAAARRGVMAAPRWTHVGPIVTNNVLQDELGAEIAKSCARGAKVLLVTETLGEGAVTREVASYARLQGCLESLLAALNVFDGLDDHLKVLARSWQGSELPAKAHGPDRYADDWNQLAVFTVWQQYRLKVSAPLARAILLADHVVLRRRAWR